MAILSTITEAKPQNELPFPKIMVHKDGTITRFKEPSVGTHITALNNTFERHDLLFKEFRGIDMSLYTDFTGSITLQNETT